NGFVVEAELRQVSGMVERETAKDMIVRYSPGAKRITVGADKGFDTADFVSDMRDFNVTPHVAQNTTNRLMLPLRRSASRISSAIGSPRLSPKIRVADSSQ